MRQAPQTPSPPVDPHQSGIARLRIVLLFAAFGAIWMLLSDQAVRWIPDTSTALWDTRRALDWAFVLAGSLVLYGLLQKGRSTDGPAAAPKAHSQRQGWLIALLASSIIGLATATIIDTIAKGKREEGARLLAVANLKSRLVADWLRERNADAQVLLHTPMLAEYYRRWRTAGQDIGHSQIIELLDEYRKHYGYRDAMLFNGPARPIWRAEGSPEQSDPLLAAAMTDAARAGEIQHLGPYRTAAGMTAIDFIIPLRAGTHSDRPIIVLRVDPHDDLYPLLDTWSVRRSSETLLFVNAGGRAKFFTDLAERTTAPSTSILADVNLSEPGNLGRIREGIDYSGVPVMGVALSIANSDWFLVTKVDRAETYYDLSAEILWELLVGILTLAAVLIGAHLMRQRHALTLARQQQSQGELLTRVSQIARLGGWEFDVATGRCTLSPEAARIHEVAPPLETDLDRVLTGFRDGSRRQIDTAIAAALDDSESYDLELELATNVGGTQWVRTMGIPVIHDGRVVKLLGTTQDITERRAAEAQLRKLSQAVEQSSEIFVITNRRGQIEYVNQTFVDITGYSREEAIGKNPKILQSGKTPKETYKAMWAALSTGQPWKGKFFNRRRDGSEYIEFAIISPIQEDGEITHYVAVKEDITEKQRMGEELDRHRAHLEDLVKKRTAELAEARDMADAANQAKSDFLANMSHEIRTPMNGVIGLLEVLEHTDLSGQQSRLIETIHQSADTLLALIDDILDFSKIEAGRMTLERVPVSIEEVCAGVCSSLAVGASRQGVRLLQFAQPGMPLVMSDGLRLRQVLYNLVGNAIKFSADDDADGHVWVTSELLQANPLRVRVRVEDNGIGMSPEAIDRLFQAFTQAEASTTRRFGGTGLGLTICKHVVDMMGGDIRVTSVLGEGSSFSVDLPLEAAADQPASDDPDLAGVHCVMVEGDERFTNALEIYLQHAGVTVSRASIDDVARCLDRPAAGQVVIFPDSAVVSDSVQACPPLPNDVAVVMINFGRANSALEARPGVTVIDGCGLGRRAFLRGIASAAGRLSVDAESSEPAQALPEDQATVVPSIAEARAQGRLILVAEDDAVNQSVILQQLNLLGYAAEVANDGAAAHALWRQGGYALLLTDLHMPEMDGYALTATIRAEESTAHIPIVALTANALHGESKRTRAGGMDDYLTKPVSLKKLRKVLGRWLPGPSAPGIDSVQPEPRAVGTGPVDLNVLRGLVGDNEEVVQELLSRFRESANEYAEALQTASDAGDISELGAIAHKLKSAARSVGALGLGDICASLESAAKTDDRTAIQRTLKQFQQVYQTVDQAIDHLAVVP